MILTWGVFFAIVLTLLWFDLRQDHHIICSDRIKIHRQAIMWSFFYIFIGIVFSGFVFHFQGKEAALHFFLITTDPFIVLTSNIFAIR